MVLSMGLISFPFFILDLNLVQSINLLSLSLSLSLSMKVCNFFVSAFVKFLVSDTSNSKFLAINLSIVLNLKNIIFKWRNGPLNQVSNN